MPIKLKLFIFHKSVLLLTVSSLFAQWNSDLELKPISPERSFNAVASINYPDQIAREQYLEQIIELYSKYRAAVVKKMDDGSGAAIYYVPCALFWYRYTIQNDGPLDSNASGANSWKARTSDEWLDITISLINSHRIYLQGRPTPDTSLGFVPYASAASIYSALRDANVLNHRISLKGYAGATLEDLIRDWMIKMESKMETGPDRWKSGAINSAIGMALGAEVLARIDDPSALVPGLDISRRSYADRVWSDFWNNGDTLEDSTHYDAINMDQVNLWIDIKSDPGLWLESGKMSALANRYLQLTTPLGPLATYGDSVGWCGSVTGTWIKIFEKWANVYNDGRYKWAAHRIFHYINRRPDNLEKWSTARDEFMLDLMAAYLAVDVNLPPEHPELSSDVLKRKKIFAGEVTSEEINYKVVFRSGNTEYDSYAALDVASELGHDHFDTGSIQTYVSNGSVLLTTPPYSIDTPEYHNAFVIIPTTIEGIQTFSHRSGSSSLNFDTSGCSKLRVTFDAKSLSGSPYISLSRRNGGGGIHFALSETWLTYQGEFDLADNYNSSALSLSTVEGIERGQIISGSFSVDNIIVECIDNTGSAYLIYSDDFEQTNPKWLADMEKDSGSCEIYFDKDEELGSRVMCVQIDASVAQFDVTDLDLSSFYSSGSRAFAELKMPNYTDQPIDVTRQVFFLGNLGMWVRDTAIATDAFSGRIGPAWQLNQLHGKDSEGKWINAAQPAVANAGIWTLDYLTHWDNRPEDLLIYFYSPNSNTFLNNEDVTVAKPPIGERQNSVSTRSFYELDANFAARDTECFNSVLIPHKPDGRPEEIANNIQIQEIMAGVTVLKYEYDESENVEIYLINETANTITLPWWKVTTDASIAYFKFGINGLEEHWLVDVTHLSQNGNMILDFPTKTTVESNRPLNYLRNSNFSGSLDNWEEIWNSNFGNSNVFMQLENGAARVSIETDATERLPAHKTGVISLFSTEALPAFDRTRICFDAKHISGSTQLGVRRLWGGSTDNIVDITSDWESYEAEIDLYYDTSNLVFGTVKGDVEGNRNTIQSGELLIDNVEITVLPNYALNPNLETDLSGWSEITRPDQPLSTKIYRETSDTHTGSNGAVRVDVNLTGSGPGNSNTNGVAVFHEVIPAYNRVRVSFWAKRVSQDFTYLHIQRGWGGSTASNVQLTDNWQYFEVDLDCFYNTIDIRFCPVNNLNAPASSMTVIPGEFLIDSVYISPILSKTIDPTLSHDITSWTGWENGKQKSGFVYWVQDSVRSDYSPLGALKAVIPPGVSGLTSDTGIGCTIDNSINYESDTLLLSFYGKRIEGANIIKVGYLNSAGAYTEVEDIQLNGTWSYHSVDIPAEAAQIMFSPASSTLSQTVSSGAYHLDNVIISPKATN